MPLIAEVAKQADALRSGRSELTLVWVRIPPSAFSSFNLPIHFIVTKLLYPVNPNFPIFPFEKFITKGIIMLASSHKP